MNKPLVSVLMCTHNAEIFIRKTLQSVVSQTYSNFEVTILDDASSDKTSEIIDSLACQKGHYVTASVARGSVRLIQSKMNIGPYKGLNQLLNEAKGKYVAINDHDDIWHPDKLKLQVEFLEKNQEYIGCGSAIINWYEKYKTYFYRSQKISSDVAWHSSLVFRNDGYRYDTTVPVATDFYFMKNILCTRGKKIFNLEEPLVLRHIFKGSNNLSGTWMKNITPLDILKLRIGLFDKAALLNRFILPQSLVERVAVSIYKNAFPEKYEDYAKTLLSSLSSQLL